MDYLVNVFDYEKKNILDAFRMTPNIDHNSLTQRKILIKDLDKKIHLHKWIVERNRIDRDAKVKA